MWERGKGPNSSFHHEPTLVLTNPPPKQQHSRTPKGSQSNRLLKGPPLNTTALEVMFPRHNHSRRLRPHLGDRRLWKSHSAGKILQRKTKCLPIKIISEGRALGPVTDYHIPSQRTWVQSEVSARNSGFLITQTLGSSSERQVVVSLPFTCKTWTEVLAPGFASIPLAPGVCSHLGSKPVNGKLTN